MDTSTGFINSCSRLLRARDVVRQLGGADPMDILDLLADLRRQSFGFIFLFVINHDFDKDICSGHSSHVNCDNEVIPLNLCEHDLQDL